MSFVKKFNLYTLLALLTTSVGLPVNSASAAPGTVADYPLFLSNSAQPNIFFLLDDSGSMHTELMTPEDVNTWGGIMVVDGQNYMYVFGLDSPPTNTTPTPNDQFYKIRDSGGTFNGIDGTNALPTQQWLDGAEDAVITAGVSGGLGLTLNASQRGVWRSRNHVYNKQYYNPANTYAPWAGENSSGVLYADITDATKTPFNPYYFSPTNTNSYVDLTSNWTFTPDSRIGVNYASGHNRESESYYPAAYNVWSDDNPADGNVDADDSYRRVEITPGNQCSALQLADATPEFTYGCYRRTYADEMKNFANWFAYHRKREYSAKYAMSQTISNETNVRMGMMSIHQRNTDNNTERANERIGLATMNPDVGSGAKQALLNTLFGTIMNPSTPLVEAYREAGEYFKCNNNVFGNGNSASSCALEKFASPVSDSPAICQQNFAIIVSDGDYASPSPAFSLNSDNDNNTSFDGNPYSFATQNMADIAMSLYENDLLPTSAFPNQVPTTCGIDENNAQHLVTYAIGFGIAGNLDPDNDLPSHPGLGLNGCPTTAGAAFNWNPGPLTGAPADIDDVVHAAFNGRGKYFEADDPTQLQSSLSDAFQSIANRTASSAAAAFNAAVISSNTQIYLTRFNSGTWTGQLLAFTLNADGSLGPQVWDAASILNALPLTDRAVVTFDPTPGTFAGIPFDWASLTTSQQADLKKNPNNSSETTTGFPFANARLEFLRGDQRCEIGGTGCPYSGQGVSNLRGRTSILGDLVNSTPVFVGPPSGDYPNTAPFGTGTETYSSYKFGQTGSNGAFNSAADNALNRTPMVYVGGNDGMLHAFIADSSADAGKELWAFVPNSVFSAADDDGLHELTEPGYEHQYYVDLTPTVIDVYADIDGDTDDDWHTVLVGGLRGGGAGLFAIDVTDPDYIRAAGMTNGSARETRLAQKVMWEFTAADDPDLGQTFSEPAVVPLGTSSGIEWYVVVGNGYESTNTTGTGGANDGNPFASKLFLIKLEGPGADGVWDIGTDYYKMDSEFPSGTSVIASDRNGLSSPALADNDGDGIFDRAYAGDVLGKMWAFDLTGDPANNNQGWSFAYASGGNPAPLFTASGGDAGAGTRQAITMRPALGRHPTVATVSSGGGVNEPNIMVYFGTGQYLVTGDLTNTDTQSFYAVWDRGDDSLTVNRSTPGAASNNLQKQTIVETTLGTNNVRYIDPDTNGDGTVDSSDTIDYTTAPMHGWYIDEPTAGERSIFNPLLRGGIVFFNTLIPSNAACGFGGSGWIMAVNQNDGKSPSDPLFDANNDTYINSGDTVGGVAVIGVEVQGGIPGAGALISAGGGGGGGGGGPPPCEPPKRPHVEIVLDSSGTAHTLNLCLPEGAKIGRYSWRELNFD